MNGESDTPARRRWLWLVGALCLLALIAMWGGWRWRAQQQQLQTQQREQLDALSLRIDRLRGDQRAQSARIQQADAINHVLRDELLGLGQRAAILEDSVHKLADPQRHGAQALRLDEVELLLSQGEQRLRLSGDLDGARHAYALAAGALDGADDPALLDLRQTLAQERAALATLGVDPRERALDGLDAFASHLHTAPTTTLPVIDAAQPWWRRALGALLTIEPSDRSVLQGRRERTLGIAALQLELTLARVAAERRDATGYNAALARADAWLDRLWPDSAWRRERHGELLQLRRQALSPDLPTLGTTLQQLRTLRATR